MENQEQSLVFADKSKEDSGEKISLGRETNYVAA